MSHFRGGFRPWDDPERRKFQDPQVILSGIGLKAGMTFADIGCGGGYFAIPAARMVGKKGRVYGLDANPEVIDALGRQAEKEGLTNVHLTIGKAEEVVVCTHCADFVFYGITLHDFEDPRLALKNARHIIKPAGKLVNLDWKKDGVPFGPPSRIKFNEAQASGLIENADFIIESVENSARYHYVITARPI